MQPLLQASGRRSRGCGVLLSNQIGFTTGDACFGEAYVAKCALKDGATTSRALGFRVAGMQHWQPSGAPSCAWACVRAERRWCKALDAAGAAAALARFGACGVVVAATARAVAAGVLRGPGGALAQLAALIAWFETQRELHFLGASVLLLFDAAPLAAAAADEARSISEVYAPALGVDVKVRACWMRCCGSCVGFLSARALNN